MNTVKQLKKSSLPFSPKRSYSGKRHNLSAFGSTLLLASLLGTYLDLYFVGKQLYQFPIRPFPEIFSINIAFTLVGLPLFTLLFLYVSNRMTPFKRFLFIFMMSLFVAVFEKQAEALGYFRHSDEWKHYYSCIGYFLYMLLIWRFHTWRSNK
ncbi:MAG TPA: CBO0543 family protein [Bacillus sp. (in: firmicutes)]|nr:CBO0543 family protein [Bacillus litorisediminis]HWO75282.1 CBO0543 family protein [Bacillus sp. (in: firmicutes)]